MRLRCASDSADGIQLTTIGDYIEFKSNEGLVKTYINLEADELERLHRRIGRYLREQAEK